MPSDLFSYRVRVGLYCDVANRHKGIKYFSFYDVIVWMSMILLLSGDIEVNPGPHTKQSSIPNRVF